MDKNLNTVVVGLGLIGSSICMALKDKMGIRPIGVDCNESAAVTALKKGMVSEVLDLEEAVKKSRFIILAASVEKIMELIKKISPIINPGSFVTDVGSTKEEIVKCADQHLPEGVNYLGGHPMAGSEKSGPEGARGNLFEKAVYVLTPTQRTNNKTKEFMKHFVTRIGAKPVFMSPEQHDEYAAVISHVPHVLAAALTNMAREREMALQLAAGGFKDMTRIALSNPMMWRDICLSNKDNIKHGLKKIRDKLADFEKILDRGDEAAVIEFFTRALQTRKTIK